MSIRFQDNRTWKFVNLGMKQDYNTHNLVLIYHPNCKFSQQFKIEWIKYAFDSYRNNKNLNMIAINDGFAPLSRKHVP